MTNLQDRKTHHSHPTTPTSSTKPSPRIKKTREQLSSETSRADSLAKETVLDFNQAGPAPDHNQSNLFLSIRASIFLIGQAPPARPITDRDIQARIRPRRERKEDGGQWIVDRGRSRRRNSRQQQPDEAYSTSIERLHLCTPGVDLPSQACCGLHGRALGHLHRIINRTHHRRA